MADQFLGKWELTKSENFEEFLKALDISWMVRKVAISTKPVVTITKEGNTFQMKTSSALKTTTVEFELDKIFEEARADGVQQQCIIKLEDGKLIQDAQGDKPYQVIREIENDMLKTTCKIGDVVAVRFYVKK